MTTLGQGGGPDRPAASPFTPDEVAGTRRPVEHATHLPARALHDPAVLTHELRAWFDRAWLSVGREEDAAAPGEYFLAEVGVERLIVVRGEDRRLRAFHNVCRHRGAAIIEKAAGRLPRIQCPYHAWDYGLDGRLRRPKHTEAIADFDLGENGLRPVALETWQGFVFVNLDPAAPSLAETLVDFPSRVGHLRLDELRRHRRIEYEVAANWKVIGDNFSECYHCPGIHPQLTRVTPYDLGRNYASDGAWAGGWMLLADGVETMSMDGSARGRSPIPGWSLEDDRRVYYFLLWPNVLLTILPDYAMTHRVWPLEPGRSRVTCEWYFHPDAMADAGFDASGVIEFWDVTNRQDWHVCALVQVGTASRAYEPGRYSHMEDQVHAFDLMCADRYADDGVTTRFGPRSDDWAEVAQARRGVVGAGPRPA
jgi:Rieske 2Fe-2S family protein